MVSASCLLGCHLGLSYHGLLLWPGLPHGKCPGGGREEKGERERASERASAVLLSVTLPQKSHSGTSLHY